MAADTSNRARAEIAKRSAAERRKLAKFLAKNGLNDEKIKSLDPVILNVSWMKSKLDDAREAIGEEGITVEYDNGGGQSGAGVEDAVGNGEGTEPNLGEAPDAGLSLPSILKA